MKESISYYSSSGCLGLHDARVIVCLPGWDAKVSGLSSYNKAGKAGWLPALATVADGLVVAADGGLEFCFCVRSGGPCHIQSLTSLVESQPKSNYLLFPTTHFQH